MSKAKQLTKERGSNYGHPLDNFRNIMHADAVLDKCEDAQVRHALRMIWVKICRLVETPDHQDSIDDIGGYAETINMIHAERKKRAGHINDLMDKVQEELRRGGTVSRDTSISCANCKRKTEKTCPYTVPPVALGQCFTAARERDTTDAKHLTPKPEGAEVRRSIKIENKDDIARRLSGSSKPKA